MKTKPKIYTIQVIGIILIEKKENIDREGIDYFLMGVDAQCSVSVSFLLLSIRMDIYESSQEVCLSPWLIINFRIVLYQLTLESVISERIKNHPPLESVCQGHRYQRIVLLVSRQPPWP